MTYIKKFAADRLQRSRNWYEKTKGLSKKQVSEALKFLQAKGVIIVDYQDLTIVDSDGKERILYNRIYLTPVPAAITTITLLERSDSKTENKDWPLDETDLETKRGWSKKTRVREQESSNTETSDDSRAKIEAEFDSEIRGTKLIAAAMELKGEALKAVVKASISPTIFDAIVMACRIKLEAIHSTDRLEVLKAAQKIWRQGYGSAPKAKISFIQWWSDHKAKPTTGKRPKTPADVADHWGQYVQFLVDHDQYLSNPVEVDDDNLRVQFIAAKLAENFWEGEIDYANYTKYMKELVVFDTLRRGASSHERKEADVADTPGSA